MGGDQAAAAGQAAPSQRWPALDGDQAVLGGIIYVLRAGVPWRLLPAKELGCGSPVTCWRRLRDWQHAGVWEQLHHRLLDWLGDHGQVDWSRAAIDSLSVRARRRGTRRRESGRPGQARIQVSPGDRRHRPAAGGRPVADDYPPAVVPAAASLSTLVESRQTSLQRSLHVGCALIFVRIFRPL